MEDRKKRLAALRARAGRKKDAESSPAEEEVEVKDASLLVGNKAASSTSTDSADKKRPRQDDKEADKEPVKKTKTALEEALEKAKEDLETGDPASAVTTADGDTTKANNNNELTAMAPKKINWDLKRDIQPKLDKLEKRTQKVIVQLLRERLAREADAAAEEGTEDLD
ncbi:Coiled-coil domain-containing protein 12 [Seminavis robusta]|uniref:Coiled-coil domain-containing protein 12 n=1 Tax=Seminavis robusta TaxID=568900 RepID=A0A9N8E490_9STRA|nr:Coiled-coil domain-containing protein 12 [Seminavis robusta]|eukprot:Sro486_g152580.1 Coiled-coil domain-containing protein 12 (168) ;mRNA; r:21630-22133